MPNILRLRPVTVMRCGVAWGLGTRLACARYIRPPVVVVLRVCVLHAP